MSDTSILGHFHLPSQGPLSRQGQGWERRGVTGESAPLPPSHKSAPLSPSHTVHAAGTRGTDSLATPGGYGQSPSGGTSANESGAHSAAVVFSISPTI